MTIEDLIATHEGRRYSQYLDTRGIPTIGIGHNLAVSPLPAGWSQPITDTQVDQLFQADLATIMAGLNRALPWAASLDPVRQGVIVDLCFNMGVHGASTFTTFLGLVQSGDYAGAAADLLGTKWASQVPNRSKEDAAMMRTGLWPDDPAFSI